ncbi:hypothetical protein [Paenibacillus sp. NPDC058071]|uniref:hypothetical protein n=1 Tax=Paenibacillus sp. NPDC058071 TaxID=3346326 RepID=UPI0036D938C4
MDKRKVIAAYRSGLISIQECAQILGLDSRQMTRIVNDSLLAAEPARPGKRIVTR